MRHARIRRATAVGVAAWLLLVPAGSAVADVGDGGDADPVDAGDADEAGEAEAEALAEGTSLGGYRLLSEASPLGVLLWEPLLPFPVDPGMPHMELQSAYTRTTFNTGPTGRALASTLWPGAVFGDSLDVVAGTDYPVMANARVPQGPEEERVELAPGMGMEARADATSVESRATTTDLPSDALGVGTYESTSRSLLEDGTAVSRVRSSVSDVELLDGIVSFDGIVTDIEARGDGAQAATSGSTSVTGLTIAGYGFVLDEDGLRPEAGEEGDEESPLPFEAAQRTPDELREALGIEVELLPHEETIEGTVAKRSAGGVRVSLDLEVLRSAYLDDVLRPLVDQLPDTLRQPPMPDEVPFNPIDLLFLEPRVDVILARGVVEANTVEKLDFEGFGSEFGDPPPAEAPAPEIDQPADLGGVDAGAPPPSTDAPAPVDAGAEAVAEPEISQSPPGEQSEQLQAIDAASFPDPAGSTMLAALLALGVAGLGARGLHGMTGRVFGAGAGCEAGHPTGVPNLKET